MKTVLYIFSLLWLCTACGGDEITVSGNLRPKMNVQDSLVMVAFYHTMKCAEWGGDFHWDLKDYETWGGVTATLDKEKNEYYVTGIEVFSTVIPLPNSYELPDELENLTKLRSLIIWGDERMKGNIPLGLSCCQLEMLYITGKNFAKSSLPKWAFTNDSFYRSIVDGMEPSLSNPELFDNWENIGEIALNVRERACTTPWSNGASSELSGNSAKLIRKVDRWVMPFHTFKKVGIGEKINYLCFYNFLSASIKVFYYKEDNYLCQGPQYFSFVVNDQKIQLLDKSEELDNILILSNRLKDVLGILEDFTWYGFEVQIPYQAVDHIDTHIRLE